jgi:hypothetical protein
MMRVRVRVASRGRKRLSIPRERRYVYLSRPAQAAVREWQSAEMERRGIYERKVSFNDALDEMIGIASFYAVDTHARQRTQSLGTVLNGLQTLAIPEHVRIEPNTGRLLRCGKCQEVHRVGARRFSGLLREVKAFVLEHQHTE